MPKQQVRIQPAAVAPATRLDAGGAGDCLHATAQLSRASIHQVLRMLPLGVRAQGLAAADGGMPSVRGDRRT